MVARQSHPALAHSRLPAQGQHVLRSALQRPSSSGIADIEHDGDIADAVTVDRIGLSVARPVDADEPNPEPVKDLVRRHTSLTARPLGVPCR